MNEIQTKDGKQHEQAACLRKDEEFERCIPSISVAPYADEEVHWDQHHFPEKIEQEKVHGQEDPADAGEDPQ